MFSRPPSPDFTPNITQPGQVIFQPQTAEYFRAGAATVVNAIAPTLGPRPRRVAHDRYRGGQSPEILDSGGLIARRIIGLENPYANMGAMFIRGALWRLYEAEADGTATAAILFQSIFEQGLKYIAAGGNAMLLRRALEAGLALMLEQLRAQVAPLEGRSALMEVAHTVCYEPALAEHLGEIFHHLGEYGALDIQPGHSRAPAHELHEGSYYLGGALAPQQLNGYPQLRAELKEAAILLTDLELDDAQALVPVLRAAVQAQIKTLVIVAAKMSEPVLGLLASSQRSGKLTILAAKTPFQSMDDQKDALADLGALTGAGRVFLKATGDTLEKITPASFGRAPKIWLDKNYLGVVGCAAAAPYLATWQQAFARAEKTEVREKIRARLGRLLGKMAVLYVGGDTEPDVAFRTELVKQTATALRSASASGILPGAGSALLACRPALRVAIAESEDDDEKAALRILDRALESPFRTLAANAGFDASAIWSQLLRAGAGHVFDARDGTIKTNTLAGIYDIAAAQMAAVRSAVSAAALALTVDALVLPHKPKVTTEPD